jgi:hypothetical protein
MKDHRARYTYIPSSKALYILRKIGLVDGRDLKLRSEKSISEFLDECVTRLLRDDANLEIAYRRHELRELVKVHAEQYAAIDRLQAELHKLEDDVLRGREEALLQR